MDKREDASTESVFQYFVENAGPIFNHAVSVFEGMSENFEIEIDKQTISGLSTHLSLLCQMVIVTVAESVYTGKDPNEALDALSHFILSYNSESVPLTAEEKQEAENFVGLLFDKTGKA